VIVEKQHDALGISPLREFVGIGVLEFLDIDGPARHGWVLELLEHSRLGCLLRWSGIHRAEVARPVRRDPARTTPLAQL
jgi:hypothetical protein